LATVLTEAVPGLTRRLQQLIGRPSIFDLQQGGRLTTLPHDALRTIMDFDDSQWEQIQAEFLEVARQLNQRRQQVLGTYPDFYAIEQGTAILIYAITRLVKPRCILETGVADGTSTYLFLAALRANGSGELHSLDIADDVGALVDNRERWHIHIHDVQSVESALADLMHHVPPIDLFLHDSDHRYLPQLFELETAAATAPPGAVIACDDVDLSYAFQTFCEHRAIKPTYLFDSRKVVGLIRLPPGS
jgi:predicted O-methyltransferase YrrM